MWDPAGWDRAAWYEKGGVSLGLAALVFAILATRALVWPVAGLVRRARGLPRPDPGPPSARLAWRLSGAASWLALLAPIAAIAVALVTLRPPITSVPVALVVLLALLLLSVISGLLLVPLAIACWRRGAWTAPRRIQVAAVAVAALVLGVLLHEYNLLGFWF